MDVLTKTLLPYSGPWMSVYYNKFFHPNLCHVCKKTTEMINLTTCDRCFFISYCSEDHKNLHLPQHREICIVIEKYLRNNPQFLTRRFNLKEWWIAQDDFHTSVKLNLKRILESYEEQMITCSRFCFICHQQTGLYPCKKCFSADYCLEHKEEFEEQHEESFCDLYTMWLNIEFLNVQYESKASLSLKFMKFPDNGSFNDMITFIEEHTQETISEWNLLDYIYADYVSGPLSVYYGMSNVELSNILLTTSTCIIHVIGASSIEKNGLPVWEILLHLFPNIQVLIVVLLGADLQVEFGMQDVCPRCVFNEKKFIYECYGTLYSNYMTDPMYGKAHLIVLFEVHEFESLDKCLKTMQSQECPVLLTTSEGLEILETDRIQQVLGRDVYPIINIKNKFMSVRPYKDYKQTAYRNSVLIIYKTLKNTKYSTSEKS
ncbi:uncharacterized protein LOC105182345 [Harpegnathos saltator]|uniref:uncharacterized protein LOC105182345 n=1 Tax=Harpegnathos saltator TaxID=610380 RepID=UPI000DBEDE34|nr:uncharacterized protein LOC105182345 [Harpegnathos saltator]